MRLIVGLGNPGAQYAGNRHNIGFMAVERIAEDHGFGPWRGKFQAEAAEGRLGREKVLLLKPQTFMNRSGQSVGEAMRFFKLEPANVVVIHDELDLAPGKCRVKEGGGHAGHNGLRSIHAAIGPEYARVRLGIGHPGHKDKVAGYVLHDFAKADAEWLDDLMRGISDGAVPLAEGDWGKFQNAVALRMKPPARKEPASTPGAARRGADAGKAPASRPDAETPDTRPPAAGQPYTDPKGAQSPAEAAGDPPAPEASRSPLQRLMDRFR